VEINAYLFEGKVESTLNQLREAAAVDKISEKKTSRYKLLALISFIMSVVCLLAATNSHNYWGFGLLVFIPLFIVGLIFSSIHGKHDLDDRKLEAAIKFISVMAADIPSGSMPELAVDFRNYKNGGRLTSYLKEGGFFQQKVYRYKYSHEWLRFSGELCDGNRFSLHVVDKVSRKEKPKRKYTKVKEHTVSKIVLSLSLSAKKYRDPSIAVAKLDTKMSPPGLRIKAVRVHGKKLTAVFATSRQILLTDRYGTNDVGAEDLASGDLLLRAFLWVYDGLAAARSAAA